MDIENIYQSKLSMFRDTVMEKSAKCGSASVNMFSDILNSIEKRIGVSYSAPLSEAAYDASDIKSVSSKSEVDSAIEAAAAKTGLDPDLLRAVIQVESSFRVKVVSGSGAQGLMQLMPGTAKEVGVTDPFDPYQNVLGGAKYLKKMLNRFGDMRLALAAYNKGPGRISSYHITDPDDPDQYSKIPAGCRGYVNKILEYYKKYSGG
jgi:soluble lytic murein transglycosylase-like protein